MLAPPFCKKFVSYIMGTNEKPLLFRKGTENFSTDGI